jgi:hypothetical protein
LAAFGVQNKIMSLVYTYTIPPNLCRPLAIDDPIALNTIGTLELCVFAILTCEKKINVKVEQMFFSIFVKFIAKKILMTTEQCDIK